MIERHSRRTFLTRVAGSLSLAQLPLPSSGARAETVSPALLGLANGKPTDVRVEEITFDYEEHRYRTPLKFGGTVTDRVTLLNVRCAVASRAGRTARGFGSMPMGNVWSFPSKALGYDRTLDAMKALATRFRSIYGERRGFAHPIDITWAAEPVLLRAADEVSRELRLGEPVPKLCTLTAASPFDAALHDAFGKLHGISSYRTYGPEFMTHDLGHYLGAEFRGEWLSRYVLERPKPSMPLYHLVGAVDPVDDADIPRRLNDGLPETLGEWIRHDGITHIKIKLNGSDLDWDVDRVARVDRAATVAQRARGVSDWVYSLDFNEKCPNVGYLLDFMARLHTITPDGFTRIQYIEQPTARDLRANPGNVMHDAARMKPIVVDESLTDYESLQLAREMGYSGAALKACKGQTQALLLGAACQKHKLFLCVQDLTCPGASLVHSVGLAAHVPTVAAIEANARQYVPSANKAWEDRYPGLFRVKNGSLDTSGLNGPGLSLPS
jgi:L-alanine-DL-glutamate epimerase-like enolase superfamily enzyme